jgi:hypothetical protein
MHLRSPQRSDSVETLEFSSKHKRTPATGIAGCAQVVSEENGRSAGPVGCGETDYVPVGRNRHGRLGKVDRNDSGRSAAVAGEHGTEVGVKIAQLRLGRRLSALPLL